MNKLSKNSNQFDAITLERQYQNSPYEFRKWFNKTFSENPENPLLLAWNARLNYQPSHLRDTPASRNLLLLTILISFVSWAIAKAPSYINLNGEWFYIRFIPFLVIGTLVYYFHINEKLNKGLILKSAVAGLTMFTVLLLLPYRPNSDSIRMALIHMPFVLLSLLGFTFCKGQWRSLDQRLNFLRFGGELVIYSGLVLLGGFVFSALTINLFEMISVDIEQWYFSNVGMWGAMSAPLIASWIWDQLLERDSRIAPILANIFSPLFLLMTGFYLAALLGRGQSPFEDRESLIVFNGLLMVVWGISVFSITGRGGKFSKVLDLTNLSLVGVTLIIDAIALAAIVYRTFTMGITPNRVAVTGANLLIFIHLIWISFEYAREFRGAGSIKVIKTTIARYLPVYTAWSMFVVVVLPLMFWFD
ncbi:MAG: hypothetical protein EBS81_08195 [Gammaproteobacteria bacterium]|nr:hypothetical protein [Gammaproteobacteria bacterium]